MTQMFGSDRAPRFLCGPIFRSVEIRSLPSRTEYMEYMTSLVAHVTAGRIRTPPSPPSPPTFSFHKKNMQLLVLGISLACNCLFLGGHCRYARN